MKISIFMLLALLSATLVTGQEYKITFQNSKDGKLALYQLTGDLPVEGYNGNEIIITSISEKLAPPERARGLKPVFPGGTDNSGLGLAVEKNGNQISVTCLLPITRKGDYKIKVPENLSLEIESGCERSSNISVINMKNEIEVKSCHDIKLINVTGPLVLSTIAGDIDITFTNIALDKPFSINSVSGDIDVTIPAKASMDLKLHTINGGFYSDFDISETQKNLKRIGGNQLSFPLNGGGSEFSIITVNGNIFLRKGN